MSTTPPLNQKDTEMQPPQSHYENGRGSSDYVERKSEEKRSRSKDVHHRKDKDSDRERTRDRSSKDDKKSRHRSRSRSNRERRERSRSQPRKRSRERKRSKDRKRSRSRGRRRSPSPSESKRSSRSHRDRRERSRSRSRHRDRRSRDRSRSRSYERRRREPSREYERDFRNSRSRGRSTTTERIENVEREPVRLETIKEETRDGRFDLSATIQELMSSVAAKQSLNALFHSANSNDSFSNGPPSENSQDAAAAERKRRKKSRWGGTENDKVLIPGMPTYLPSTLDPTQQEAYLIQLQIEEISRKLRTGELGIPQNPEERSPSPEPIYSSDGKRLNTREFRWRKRLEEQRHQLVQKMQAVNPEFKPPADYKPPVTRVSDKVLIPQEEHPNINFVGLIIGPRGNTLKAMEKETGAKIIIRGKGSIKEGKVARKDGQPIPGEDEPLHAFVTASNTEAVKKAVEKVKDVIKQGIEVPEGHNDLRRMQLRELALLNGTLRETDCPRCGSSDHKSWLCPDKPLATTSIVCTICGGGGHLTKDCRSKRPGAATGQEGQGNEDSQAKIDEEYMSLMAELGEGPPPPSQQQKDPMAQVHMNRGFNLFDKKPAQPLAIQGPPPSGPANLPPPPPIHTSIPPPSAPPAAWGHPPPASGLIPPPLIPPPPTAQPPPAPPQMNPWMPQGNAGQPPPPGTGLHPPGTGPMPPMPPGTGPMPPSNMNSPMPPWPPMPGFGSWGLTPPPPPPCGPPPPVIPSLTQPPPPPPPPAN